MRVAYCSDLHLEFADLVLDNTIQADVLVLAGDILKADDLHSNKNINHIEPISKLGRRQSSALIYRNFLKDISNKFKHIIVVAGNHEFYDGKWVDSIEHLKEEYSSYHNIYFLENGIKKIEDCTFIGGTLWTNLNKGDPITVYQIKDLMSDYRVIRNDSREYSKLRPIDTLERHRKTLNYFSDTLSQTENEKFVVVSHHAPSELSVAEMYKDDYVMNGAYFSDLSNFILDNPQIKVWVHGHMHTNFDYNIGDTRVLCNPRGYYGYEVCAYNFNLKFFDI